MKKLLVLMLVLGMASLANATLIDVIADGLGDAGHTGISTDPLDVGETLHLQMVLNWVEDSFPGGGYPTYDGYVMSGMNLDLTAASGVTMGVDLTVKMLPDWGEHADWTFKGSPSITSNVLSTGPYASTASTMGTTLGIDTLGVDDIPLLWNFYVTNDGTTDSVSLTWSLTAVPGQYYDYVGDGIVTDPTATDITLGDLGGLTIHTVPEPATMALLGLGGLCLLRRRR